MQIVDREKVDERQNKIKTKKKTKKNGDVLPELLYADSIHRHFAISIVLSFTSLLAERK